MILLILLLLAPLQAAPSADQTARALQEKYDHVQDFTADFTHTYVGGVLKKKTTESGVVQVKKPGRMRWDYAAPEKKEFVSDGQKIYSYIPADKQVIVSSMPADNQTTAVLFLTGKGNLTRDFTVTYADGAAADAWSLKLVPTQKQRDYDWLVLTVDRKTLQIRTLVRADHQGDLETFQFTHYRENTGIPDKTFEFKIPRGVDVIYSDSDR